MGQTRIDVAHPALGTDVNRDWLAYRAITNTPFSGRRGSAFASTGAAQAGIQAAVAELTKDWLAARSNLLRTGRIQQVVPVASAGVAYLSDSSQQALLPTWLGGSTNRKLHNLDTRGTDLPTLTEEADSPSGTEVRMVMNRRSPNGWFVRSAWPTI